MKTYCIYHSNCSDGLMSAAIVHKALDGDVEFIAGRYHDDIPDINSSLIYFVDFSFKLPSMMKLLEKGNKIVLIDHHKSAIEELDPLINGEFKDNFESLLSIDNSNSGAGLTWEYFFPGTTAPALVKYIEDRDIWKWEFKNTKEVTASFFLEAKTIENYLFWLNQSYFNPLDTTTHFCKKGSTIIEVQNNQIDSSIKHDIIFVDIDGFQIPCVNASVNISELGDVLHTKFESQYSIVWTKTISGFKFSFRSSKDKQDVSVIAKRFHPKGGGHYSASGALVPTDEVHDNELAKKVIYG